MFVGVALILVAVVGHGLWRLAANVFRALGGGTARPADPSAVPGRMRCARCGTFFSRVTGACPACGLDPAGPVARELTDLEGAARSLQSLVDRGALDPALAEQVYQGLETRQQHLVQTGRPGPVAAEPVRARLERLVTSGDPRTLSATGRRQALAWYEALSPPELEQLSEAGLLGVGRLLRSAGMVEAATSVYAGLERRYGPTPEFADDALEEAERQAKEGRHALARRFAAFARHPSLPTPVRERAAAVEAGLPAERLVMEVIPAPPEPEPVVPPPLPRPPRRSFGQMLGEFMEDRNILWGEIVGGLLIVGCSIALVVSLWTTLEQQVPYFPFLIFAALTVALFAAGRYTHRHWKLEASSRGLMIIATLLVPLSFTVLAGLSRGRESGPLEWFTEVIALAGFGWLVWRAAAVLLDGLPGAAGPVAVAVVGAAGTQLLVPRWVDVAGANVVAFVLLSLTPAVLQALAVAPVVVRLGRREAWTAGEGYGLLLALGLTVFSAAVSLGFIVYWGEDPVRTARLLAVPVAVAGLPLVLGGALAHRRLRGADAAARLTSTTVGLIGLTVMLAALGLAWPRPAALVTVGVVNAVVMIGLALAMRLPWSHAPGLACLAVAFVTGFHWARGEIGGDVSGSQLLGVVTSSSGAVGLTWFGALAVLVGEALAPWGRRQDAAVHHGAAVVAALLAFAAVVAGGFAEPQRGAFVFAVAAAGALLANLRWRSVWITFASSYALLGCVVFLTRWLAPEWATARVWLFSFLVHASAAGAAGVALGWRRARNEIGAFAAPLLSSGMATSVAAVAPLAASVHDLPVASSHSLWLAALWLALAGMSRWPGGFAAGQAMLFLAAGLGAAHWLRVRGEAVGEPAGLQAVGLGLAAVGLVWAAVRRFTRRWPTGQALLEPGWMAADRVVVTLLVFAQALLAIAVLAPNVVYEVTGTLPVTALTLDGTRG